MRRKKPGNFLAFIPSLLNLVNFVLIGIPCQSLIKYPLVIPATLHHEPLSNREVSTGMMVNV